MKNLNGPSASGLIESSKAGREKDCPTRRFCGEAGNASTRSTHFCIGYESIRRHPRSTCNAGATSSALVWRSISILVEARIHLVRWTDRPDCDHADRAGGEEKMDQPIAISARPEFLHAASRPRSATTRDLHRLAASQNPRRHR